MQTVSKKEMQLVQGGNVTTPQGFFAGGLHCGIRKTKLDLGWLYSVVPATTAGVYTTNVFQAAPLLVTQESISNNNKIQAILVNSGVANACTGEQGLTDAYEMRRVFAEEMNISELDAAIASTGLIGVPLPIDKIKAGISRIHIDENTDASKFEQAILTTDTCVKNAAVEFEVGGKKVTIGGAAKGSGMIHPNMATMLSFVTTDAAVKEQDLADALKDITNQSFNMITVDGDTSTNDMVLVMANGKANNETLTKESHDWPVFVNGLKKVCQILAKKIARDGEGATKLIEVQVNGAATDVAARAISKAIISSNLVKAAIYGADPNWGRIVTAIGYSGQQVNPNNVKVAIGSITVVDNGLPLSFDEEKAKDYLSNETINIYVDLKQGNTTATGWGCDLSYDYVKINASYRT
ncbi:bifunctional ornithine acetyltransferase/N-acetylglutamate synthase [Aquibacillus sp. 3ASR75-11]|uniref:Arginine biosynthesis bifunctional protein ArgJ n=1 Tax=Terrihalobacillus insolitus TaxID=2950438 RepID=A0A9X3WTQ4_9BACI|nr:bifunctional ornithine acetyltransferase/N-acetylglutamate synthase [Terrihalobacillus insolitus]MDC3424458.1 bifunctional ornithine acetyltransferase/N-acetylglutamate synthase [Terrihalobacillus insolitus]